jgi:tight adherence protein C
MFLTIFDYVGIVSLVVLVLIWMVFYMVGAKYNDLFAPLDEKNYPLKDLYGIGYAIMQLIPYKYNSKWDKLLKNDLGILYTDKYVDYYIRIIYAQIVTIDLMVLIFGNGIMLISGESTLFVMILFFMAVFTYYFYTLPKITIGKRSDELMMDYAEVVSNLALLTNAGMILREAWTEVAYSNNGVFYKEMQQVAIDLNNGVGEQQSFRDFGIRCVIPEAKKLASTITQGIQKGNSELAKTLQEQSSEVWELKKQLVKRQGEKAANRLMIPIYLMFIGILIMIIIPIFANLF